MSNFDYSNFSNNGIQSLHKSLSNAFHIDEACPADNKIYGVRHYSDWREQSDALEAELLKRKLTYLPIPWDKASQPPNSSVIVNTQSITIKEDCKITIEDGKIYIDGVHCNISGLEINIQVNGNISMLSADAFSNLTVNGNVGDIKTSSGNIHAQDITGNADTSSGDIICNNVSGSASTGSGKIFYR